MSKLFDALRRRFRPYIVLKQAIINLHSGTTFKGIIFAQHDLWVELRNVAIMADRGQDLKGGRTVDGAVLVALSDIDFIQVIN